MSIDSQKNIILEKGFFYLNDGQFDVHLFHEGTGTKSYRFFGAHMVHEHDLDAVRFVVWAPNAKEVHLVGDFNEWNDFGYPLKRIDRKSVV